MGITGGRKFDKTNKGYHKLILWTKFRELLSITYELTGIISKSEDFGLISQMRRAIVSVISNFVEGYLKVSKKEKLHFLETSNTSLMEVEGQSEVCLMLKYWNQTDYEKFDKKRSEAGYFLHQYIKSLKNSQ